MENIMNDEDYNTRVAKYLKQKENINKYSGLDFVDEFLLLQICKLELKADFPEETGENFKII